MASWHAVTCLLDVWTLLASRERVRPGTTRHPRRSAACCGTWLDAGSRAWSDKEVKILSQYGGRQGYVRVVEEIARLGGARTEEQCRAKMHTLRKKMKM